MNSSMSTVVNLPYSHINCFSCGSSLPHFFTQKVRVVNVKPQIGENDPDENIPFYPELLGKECPPGAVIRKDGTTRLCPFCLALLEEHFRRSRNDDRRGGGDGIYSHSYYTVEEEWRRVLRKFKCTVCGIETYRKRVRLLPVQKFQFLEKKGKFLITLDEVKCVIVCLDCSETLWIQNDEYDRFKLPLSLRYFNWFRRPPPPEDSHEAILARLPSGLAKYPRRSLMETMCIQKVTETVTVKSSLLIRQSPTAMKIQSTQESLGSNTWVASTGHGQQLDVTPIPQGLTTTVELDHQTMGDFIPVRSSDHNASTGDAYGCNCEECGFHFSNMENGSNEYLPHSSENGSRNELFHGPIHPPSLGSNSASATSKLTNRYGDTFERKLVMVRRHHPLPSNSSQQNVDIQAFKERCQSYPNSLKPRYLPMLMYERLPTKRQSQGETEMEDAL